MPNFATVFKEETIRLARKELRKELEGLKKASAAYRSEIASLKRRVLALEKQVDRPPKKAIEPDSEATAARRFSGKGLASKRKGLGLSAADMGALLGVSAQTIYNWETGKTQPRKEQLGAVAALRKMGKRQARAQLASGAE